MSRALFGVSVEHPRHRLAETGSGAAAISAAGEKRGLGRAAAGKPCELGGWLTGHNGSLPPGACGVSPEPRIGRIASAVLRRSALATRARSKARRNRCTSQCRRAVRAVRASRTGAAAREAGRTNGHWAGGYGPGGGAPRRRVTPTEAAWPLPLSPPLTTDNVDFVDNVRAQACGF